MDADENINKSGGYAAAEKSAFICVHLRLNSFFIYG
jgi:hypothetical protein